MKEILFLFLILSFFNCTGKKSVLQTNPVTGTHNCPTQGNCTLEIKKNSKLKIDSDEFGNLYHEIVPGDKNVVVYNYTKKTDEKIADEGYREIIMFEFDTDEINVNLRDKNLQKVNLVFGRFCYCDKREVGLFRVLEGELNLIKNSKEINISLKFKAKVPQQIEGLNATISLE